MNSVFRQPTSAFNGQILVGGVDAVHPDLTWVVVSCPYGGAVGSPGGGLGEPVLTLDQLTAIATGIVAITDFLNVLSTRGPGPILALAVHASGIAMGIGSGVLILAGI